MSLTPKEQFRLGFLLRCAEEGCTMADIQERTKLAWDVGKVMAAVGNVAKKYWTAPLHLAGVSIAGAGVAGAGLGYGAAKLTDSDIDPADAKRQELIAAYKLQADKARRTAARKSYRQPRLTAPSLM